MAGRVRDRRIPTTRGLDPELRRKRLLAARLYAAGTCARVAIMRGEWDSGAVVRDCARPKRKGRKVRNA